MEARFPSTDDITTYSFWRSRASTKECAKLNNSYLMFKYILTFDALLLHIALIPVHVLPGRIVGSYITLFACPGEEHIQCIRLSFNTSIKNFRLT